jgi:hypothetical protein
MPKTLFDDDGNKVEVKTEEEIKAETDAQIEAAKKEVQDQSKTQIEMLTGDLNKAKEDLDKVKQAGGKSPEEQAEIAKKEQEVKDKQDLVDQAKAAGIQATLQMYTDEQVDKLAGNDAKLKEAIKANLKELTGKETKEQVNHMIRQAYVLGSDAVGVQPSTTIFNQNFGMGGGGGRPPVGSGGSGAANISSDLKDLGTKFGIEDADWEKWGSVKLSSAES